MDTYFWYADCKARIGDRMMHTVKMVSVLLGKFSVQQKVKIMDKQINKTIIFICKQINKTIINCDKFYKKKNEAAKT